MPKDTSHPPKPKTTDADSSDNSAETPPTQTQQDTRYQVLIGLTLLSLVTVGITAIWAITYQPEHSRQKPTATQAQPTAIAQTPLPTEPPPSPLPTAVPQLEPIVDTSSWNTYYHPVTNTSIKYPPDWTVWENENTYPACIQKPSPDSSSGIKYTRLCFSRFTPKEAEDTFDSITVYINKIWQTKSLNTEWSEWVEHSKEFQLLGQYIWKDFDIYIVKEGFVTNDLYAFVDHPLFTDHLAVFMLTEDTPELQRILTGIVSTYSIHDEEQLFIYNDTQQSATLSGNFSLPGTDNPYTSEDMTYTVCVEDKETNYKDCQEFVRNGEAYFDKSQTYFNFSVPPGNYIVYSQGRGNNGYYTDYDLCYEASQCSNLSVLIPTAPGVTIEHLKP